MVEMPSQNLNVIGTTSFVDCEIDFNLETDYVAKSKRKDCQQDKRFAKCRKLDHSIEKNDNSQSSDDFNVLVADEPINLSDLVV